MKIHNPSLKEREKNFNKHLLASKMSPTLHFRERYGLINRIVDILRLQEDSDIPPFLIWELLRRQKENITSRDYSNRKKINFLENNFSLSVNNNDKKIIPVEDLEIFDIINGLKDKKNAELFKQLIELSETLEKEIKKDFIISLVGSNNQQKITSKDTILSIKHYATLPRDRLVLEKEEENYLVGYSHYHNNVVNDPTTVPPPQNKELEKSIANKLQDFLVQNLEEDSELLPNEEINKNSILQVGQINNFIHQNITAMLGSKQPFKHDDTFAKALEKIGEGHIIKKAWPIYDAIVNLLNQIGFSIKPSLREQTYQLKENLEKVKGSDPENDMPPPDLKF